jgi:hypothetical protein
MAQTQQNCIALPTLPTSLPVGLTLGVPKAGLGINLALNLCCNYNVPLSVSTDDLIALLSAAGLSVHTLQLTGNLLAPIQAQLIAANTYIKNLPLYCPIQ